MFTDKSKIERNREIHRLRIEEGLSYKEIGERLEMTPSSVKNSFEVEDRYVRLRNTEFYKICKKYDKDCKDEDLLYIFSHIWKQLLLTMDYRTQYILAQAQKDGSVKSNTIIDHLNRRVSSCIYKYSTQNEIKKYFNKKIQAFRGIGIYYADIITNIWVEYYLTEIYKKELK